MKTNRQRNVARRSKQVRTAPISTPEAGGREPEAGPPAAAGDSLPPGFVSQNTSPAVSTVPDSTPEAGGREPEAGPPAAAGDSLPPGFVSQNTSPAVSTVPDSTPEAGSRTTEAGPPVAAGDSLPPGFVSQNADPASSTAPISTPEAGGRTTEAGPPVAAGDSLPERNRQNAQHSTGPRTPEGKAASAQNAFKHGLSIHRHAILPTEDPAHYAQILDELRDIYEPRSRREDLAVEDIAQCRWALQRFDEAEAVALEKETRWCTQDTEEPTSVGEALGHCAGTLIDFNRMDRDVIKPDTVFPTFDKIHRYRTWWDRRLQRTLAELDRAQRSRRQEAQAHRQAEAHARKLELAALRDQRQHELHHLRLALAEAKLDISREKQRRELQSAEKPGTHQAPASTAAFLNATPPGPAKQGEEHGGQYRHEADGFVSQNGPTSAETHRREAAESSRRAA